MLPVRIDTLHAPDNDATFRAIGFDFAAPHPENPALRAATLPEGWSHTKTPWPSWTRIEDELGRERVSVYYVQADDELDAFMRITPLSVYLRRCRMDKLEVRDDEHWAAPALIVEAAGVEVARLDREAASLEAFEANPTAADRLDSISHERAWWTTLADRHTEELSAASVGASA